MSREKLGTVVSIISGASFATLAVLSKLAYAQGLRVPTVLFWRFTGASLIFLAYLALRGQLVKYETSLRLKLLLMGAVGYGSMSACFLLAAERIPASLAGMLLYLYPAFVTLATVALKQETMNLQKGAALLIASVGMVLVLGASLAKVNLLGLIFGVGAAVVYTVYIVAGSKIISSLEPINSTMYIMFGGAVTYTAVGLITHSLSASFPPSAWLVVIGIILIPTVIAVLFFWLGVQYIGPSKTSIISTIEPVITVILGWLVFNERLTITQLGGGLLIIASIIILQYPFKEQKESSCS